MQKNKTYMTFLYGYTYNSKNVCIAMYIYMGYANGASNSRNDSERGGKDEKGDGFTLTADKH